MAANNSFRWFREDLCNRCGDCFRKCPVLHLSEQAAKREIQALIDGDTEDSLVFKSCTTCNVCDSACPKNAYPYELILERFNDYGKELGLPFLAKLVLPNEPENIWSNLRILMSEHELVLLRSWEENLHTRKKQILLTGFYTNIVPYLASGKVLDDLRPLIAGSEGLWGCGGDSNKLGAIALTVQVQELLQKQFERMGVEKVYCFMEAEAAMLAEILPKRFGTRFNFEVLPLDYWILEKLERGEVRVVNRLNRRVTVHDNCMSRYFDGKPQDVVRRIVALTGGELVEMEHNRFDGLCCGWAATIPTLYRKGSNNPFGTLMYLLHSLSRRLQEAEATGAEIVVTSCPACYIFLSMMKELVGSRIEVCHCLEIVQLAAGEPNSSRTPRRCWDILAVATNIMLQLILSRKNWKRFFPQRIDPGEVQALPRPMERDARRLKKIARFYRSPAVQNPVSKLIIASVIKTAVAAYRAMQRIRGMMDGR
jgi:Fe-S oxidoreductase